MDNGELLQCDTPNNIINNPHNDFVKNLFNKATAQFAHYQAHVDE